MINKSYCMSSYLAFRFIERDDMEFYPGIEHKKVQLVGNEEKIYVQTAADIDQALREQLKIFKGAKKGIMLSGGMDSGIVASYLERGDIAYTFRFLDGTFQAEEMKRANYYAEKWGLNLRYVDIDWEIVNRHLDSIMQSKGSPVHSIEPQIVQAALVAKKDHVEIMFIGNGSDYNFGGMDQLLKEDWTFEKFMKRYIFTEPSEVLNHSVSMQYAFEPYRVDDYKIDFLSFLNDVCLRESFGSYQNAFSVAGVSYCDPYEKLKMKNPLDLSLIRSGKSKYLIRDLMKQIYPEIPIPNKLPMPRPVNMYFNDWDGPTRPEFKNDLNMNSFSGNQKWQLYCLERFLNLNEPLR